MDWRELKETFQNLLRQCEGSAHEIDCSLLRPTCHKAGKALFEMLSEGKNPFGLGDEFISAPIAESMPPDGSSREHYSEYWLCVLGFLAQEEHITVLNRKLANTKIPPISWAAIDYELRVAERFFIDRKSYICEVCNGSIQACRELLREHPDEKWWQPPKGTVSTNDIVEKYNVPPATLEGWRKKDKGIVKFVPHPTTKQIWHPIKWLMKRLETYNPKTKK